MKKPPPASTGASESGRPTTSRLPSRTPLRRCKEAIDNDSPTGQLVFHIFGALAEFERALIRERTQAGLQATRARGRLGGRRKRLNSRQRAHAVELYRSRQHTVKEVCSLMGTSRATLYAYVDEFPKQP